MDMYQKGEMRKNKKMDENAKSLPSTSINWYPGHMAKAKREIQEKVDLIDIVFEVIDSRIPFSSKNKEMEEIGKQKPRILVMTKADLCDCEVSEKWKRYYEDMGYQVVMLDLLHDKSMNSLLQVASKLTKEVNEKRRAKGLKARRVRVLILGIPNVGKSTLINRLVGKKAAMVGNRPGVTKSLEWIRINQDMELLDTPGILWPKLEQKHVALNLAAMTAVKEEILNKEEVAIYIIETLKKMYPGYLFNRYHVEEREDVVEFLDGVANSVGAIRNGEIDYEKVYTILMKDLREGYLGKVTFDEYAD